MATFRGAIQGSHGIVSRLGSARSGLNGRLAGWQGAVRVTLYQENGRDCAEVVLEDGNSYAVHGPSIVLYNGPIDRQGREVASGHVPNPPKEA